MRQDQKTAQDPEEILRQGTFTQKKTASQERLFDYHELEENLNLDQQFVFQGEFLPSKHCQNVTLNIECLKHNPTLNNLKISRK